MTPPLSLAELVKTWEERSRKCYRDGEYTSEYHLDRCIDELAALPLGRCETCREWQPIASAPKDGAYVLVCNATAKTPVPWVASYRLPMYGEPQNQTHYEKEWRTSGGHWMTTTHWMPLPTPPAAGEETRDGK